MSLAALAEAQHPFKSGVHHDMTYYGSSEEHQPVMYLRGYPVYAAHFVVLVFIISMLATTMLLLARATALSAWVVFDSNDVLHGEVWRVFTYGLWNPPSLGFALDMLMIVWFGRDVEKMLGRAKFLLLYVCVYLLTPVLFTALGKWMPFAVSGETGAFAIFIAFATLYPNAAIFFALLAKWVAWIIVAILSLMALAARDWPSLLSLWATTGFAYGYIRHEQGHFQLPRLRWPRRKPKLRALPDLPRESKKAAVDSSMAEVDALLDKIAKSGISSLTARERARLDAAREDLKRRSSR